MTAVDYQRQRRETLRWYVLLTLNAGGYLGCGEAIVFNTVLTAVPDATAREIRVELDYLERRELVKVEHRDGPAWLAKLTRMGQDLVEYVIPCEPGIARPAKYWGE